MPKFSFNPHIPAKCLNGDFVFQGVPKELKRNSDEYLTLAVSLHDFIKNISGDSWSYMKNIMYTLYLECDNMDKPIEGLNMQVKVILKNLFDLKQEKIVLLTVPLVTNEYVGGCKQPININFFESNEHKILQEQLEESLQEWKKSANADLQDLIDRVKSV